MSSTSGVFLYLPLRHKKEQQKTASLGPVEVALYTLSPRPINVMSQPDNNVMMIKMILIEIANGGHYHYS